MHACFVALSHCMYWRSYSKTVQYDKVMTTLVKFFMAVIILGTVWYCIQMVMRCDAPPSRPNGLALLFHIICSIYHFYYFMLHFETCIQYSTSLIS
jgi:hypothetical protein